MLCHSGRRDGLHHITLPRPWERQFRSPVEKGNVSRAALSTGPLLPTSRWGLEHFTDSEEQFQTNALKERGSCLDRVYCEDMSLPLFKCVVSSGPKVHRSMWGQQVNKTTLLQPNVLLTSAVSAGGVGSSGSTHFPLQLHSQPPWCRHKSLSSNRKSLAPPLSLSCYWSIAPSIALYTCRSPLLQSHRQVLPGTFFFWLRGMQDLTSLNMDPTCTPSSVISMES